MFISEQFLFLKWEHFAPTSHFRFGSFVMYFNDTSLHKTHRGTEWSSVSHVPCSPCSVKAYENKRFLNTVRMRVSINIPGNYHHLLFNSVNKWRRCTKTIPFAVKSGGTGTRGGDPGLCLVKENALPHVGGACQHFLGDGSSDAGPPTSGPSCPVTPPRHYTTDCSGEWGPNQELVGGPTGLIIRSMPRHCNHDTLAIQSI